MAQWVQHKSGQGEMWEVEEELSDVYRCVKKPTEDWYKWLPKSEYVLCDPPTPQKRWVDVTAECEFRETFNRGTLIYYGHEAVGVCELSEAAKKRGYRLRKVLLEHGPTATQKYAFIVEKE